MTAPPLDTDRRDRLLGRIARHPDVLVIVVFLLSSAVLGFSRKEFTGDGVRHLAPILRDPHPRLGEPRWLFFPAFLFALLRPVVVLGLANSVEGLTRPMMAATLGAAALYLFSVRACLAALRVPPGRRAASLMVAGFSSGLFFAATDLMEPIFAASIATAGLAFAARRQSIPGATWEQRRNAVVVAVAATAVASLLYQGVILAVGLLPVFVPFKVLRDRRTVIASLAILAAVPVMTMGVLMLAGNTAIHALGRFSQGEENPLYRSYLKKSGIGPYIVALFGGPPQGILAIPEFHGFRSLISGLRASESRTEALGILTRLGIASVVFWAVVLASVRRGDVGTVIAVAVLLSLPLIRHQQYSYLKYYILIPVLLASVAARAPARWVVPVIITLIVINGAVLIGRIRADRRQYASRMPIYESAGAADCWVTTGWGPAISFKWPGMVCGVLGRLAGGSGNDVSRVIAQSHSDLTNCLQACFCTKSNVYTDDMIEANRPSLVEAAVQFRYTDVDLTNLTVSTAKTVPLSSQDSDPSPVYRYPDDEQHRICSLMNASR